MIPINIKITGSKDFCMLTNNDDLVVKNFLTKPIDAYEPMSMQLWIGLCKYSPIIIDVGSYTGIYSLCAAATYSDHRVFAYEALDVVYERLEMNQEINNLQNLYVYNNAVCDTECDVELKVFNKHAKLTTGSSINNRKPRPLIKNVKGICLDTSMKYMADKIGVIKIDAESAENFVLEGAKNIIATHKPDILIEILPDSDLDFINNFLDKFGYNYYYIDDSKMIMTEIHELMPATGMHDLNKLATIKQL